MKFRIVEKSCNSESRFYPQVKIYFFFWQNIGEDINFTDSIYNQSDFFHPRNPYVESKFKALQIISDYESLHDDFDKTTIHKVD